MPPRPSDKAGDYRARAATSLRRRRSHSVPTRGPGLQESARRCRRPAERRSGSETRAPIHDALGRASLDISPGTYDCLVDHLTDRGKVVVDEHVRDSRLLANAREQVEDLRPDGDVKRGDRLIEHKQLRFGGQSADDGHALTLAADSAWGRALICRASSPTCSPSSRIRTLRSDDECEKCRDSISSIESAAVWRGSNELYGSWNTIWMSRPRSGRRTKAGRSFRRFARAGVSGLPTA